MKKTIFVCLLGALSMFFLTRLVLAKNDKKDSDRVYVLTDNAFIKSTLGVIHEFPGGFSTNASAKAKTMAKLNLIKTAPVQVYEIIGKPTCDNDGVCESELGENPSCADCKNDDASDPDPISRNCFPSQQMPWGIKKVNGGTGGAGVKVAVLDSGVLKDHLDLKDNVVDCKDATKRGIKNGCADRNGHGTHVSGTILANGGVDGQGIYGVAPEAKLMAVKVCGSSGVCYGDDVAAGIYYAANNGADVISMSLGGDSPDLRIRDAVDYAATKDVLVIAAAGNDGPAEGTIDYPGAFASVMAVGAINSSEEVADFSSRGINDGDGIIEEGEVELAAPGVDVLSTFNNGCYAIRSGTSMATPHVSGLAAKLWQSSASNTRNYLKEVARDIWNTGEDSATGFGLPVAP